MLSAAISAITGVAGGIILLSILLVTVSPLAVVPVHGAVQLVANASRLAVFWEHVRWRVVLRFVVMALPGSFLGAALVSLLSPRTLQIIIATAILFTLVARIRPAEKISSRHLRWFWPLGLLCGGLGMVVGSTGPLVTQALLWSGVTKEAHVATKAACQAGANIIKLALYGTTLGFAFGEHGLLIAVMGAGVVLGTLLGKRVLSAVSDGVFVVATKVLLAAIALKSLFIV